MSNQQVKMHRIRHLFGTWISWIKLNNAENYTDINRSGEGLTRRLLNKIFGYQLEDLNKEKSNFTGLDIGDKEKSLIAFQVTSRTDNLKIIKSLKGVITNGYEKTFTRGIKFFILNDSGKLNFTKRVVNRPESILPSFRWQEDILYPTDLIRKIEEIYDGDANLLKFNEISLLLENELALVGTSSDDIHRTEVGRLTRVLENAIRVLDDKQNPSLHVNHDFFSKSLKTPKLNLGSSRDELVQFINDQIKLHDLTWIHGSPSTGKTSLAVLVSDKSKTPVYWIESRDLQPGQLREYILMSLIRMLDVDLHHEIEETLDMVLSRIEPGSLIILNDLPDLKGNEPLKRFLSRFISVGSDQDISILITSLFNPPTDLGNSENLDILILPIPPFENSDTQAVLQKFGASEENSELFASIVTKTTEGHPLLVQAAGDYLRKIGWEVNMQTIKTLFSGKFGDTFESENYSRVLDLTSDPSSRTLLYRLGLVIGTFDMTIVRRISMISPTIENPIEKLTPLIGIWLQPAGDEVYQLSPLIKRMRDNVDPAMQMQITYELGKLILERGNISQVEAYTAIFYFRLAQAATPAAFILLRVLTEFISQPEMFFDWGFDLFWFYEKFPEKVAPLLKVQIRVMQIGICQHLKKDPGFLITDLKQIISSEDIGTLGLGISNLLFYQLDLTTNPLVSMQSLASARQNFERLKNTPFDIQSDLFNKELLNGAWLIFSQLHTNEEFVRWFELFLSMHAPSEITDPYKNEMYIMAAESLYRNVVLKNRDTPSTIPEILKYLISIAFTNGLNLIATYALKLLARFLVGNGENWMAIDKLSEEYKILLDSDQLYWFLYFSELGRLYYYNGDQKIGAAYLETIEKFQPPKLYQEYLDFLITVTQARFVVNKDPKASAGFAFHALEFALQSSHCPLEDKVNLYGEAAIGATSLNDLRRALILYNQGYSLLLDHFNNNDDQKAIVIRYGNAVKYVAGLINAQDKGAIYETEDVIPNPGYFYRGNENILKDAYYFDERKFMVSTVLQNGFENLQDIDNAKKWAYRSIELSAALPAAEYIPLLQANIFYLIQDREYRQAYNVLASVENFYMDLRLKIENGETIDEGLRKIVQDIKRGDLPMYFFILLPTIFNISIGIVENQLAEDQYKDVIDQIFMSDKFPVQDVDSFSFAKQIFTKIMVERISYSELQTLFQEHPGEYNEILFLIASLLISNFTGATKAARIQMSNLVGIDNTMRKMKGAYLFGMIPYFEKFWKNAVGKFPSEFTSKEHLFSKGFPLIEKASWDNKMATIFRVVTNHLNIDLSSAISDFIT
jgi:hypothetical protein